MNNRRAKLMAGATVLGLGALGGAATATNPGVPAGQTLASNNSGPVVSGASATAATQPIAGAPSRAPIVTRASGGGPVEIDD